MVIKVLHEHRHSLSLDLSYGLVIYYCYCASKSSTITEQRSGFVTSCEAMPPVIPHAAVHLLTMHRLLPIFTALVLLLICYYAVEASKQPSGLLNPVMSQLDPPDGFCAGTTEILHLNAYVDRQGISTSFDAIFAAAGGRTHGWIAFGAGDREVEQYIPAMSPATVYTLTVTFPTGVVTAPLLIYTTGGGCLFGKYTARAGMTAMYSVLLRELMITVR